MKLKDKLDVIEPENIVSELDKLIKTAKVSISYTGQRLMQINGYEGQVTINEFAEKFLCAPAFRAENAVALEDRLACDELWTKVQGLYEKSDKKLGKTSSLLQQFTHLREFRPYCRACAGDPQAVIGEWDFGGRRDSLFEFRPEVFKSLFGNVEPKGKSSSSLHGEFWTASKSMVEEVYEKNLARLSKTARP